MSELTKEHFDQQLGALATKTELERQFESLAQMVARGFEQTASKTDINALEKRIAALEAKIDALSAKLTAHLDLSDKRYLELKRRETILAKWIKQIADKTGINIDLQELEKF